jgi:hypothetical protein
VLQVGIKGFQNLCHVVAIFSRERNPIMKCKLLYGSVVLLLAGVTILAETPKGKDPANVDKDILIEAPAIGAVQAGPPPGDVIFHKEVIPGSKLDGGTFSWVASEMSFGGKPVKGAPYAAEAVTETTQTLADGNRIQRKTTASIYRDSEGRTRREQTLGQIGPWANSGDAPQMIFINDPVAGVNYVLNPKEHTARKLPTFTEKVEPPPGAAAAGARVMRFERSIAGGPGEAIGLMHMQADGLEAKPQTESLGKQVIEGVEAEGTRTTLTIPAGQIGNEQAIQIVSERWFSPELQSVLMSKHSDPRMGETVYRVSGINRSEQPKALFEVPSDYKIEEGGPPIQRFRTMKKPDAGN